MSTRLVLGSLIALVILLIAAGCSEPAELFEPAVIATAVPTTPLATVPVTTVSTPGPVQTLPSYWDVQVQVQSNGQAINPQILTVFRGGMGMNVIPEIDIKVTRSDGIVETGKMTQPLYVGQTVTLAGTTSNSDRVEVWVISPQGDSVKIYDQYVPFRSYN
jgi:hypothetical protein